MMEKMIDNMKESLSCINENKYTDNNHTIPGDGFIPES